MNKLPVPTEEMEGWHLVPYYGWCARIEGAAGGFVTLRSIARGLLTLARTRDALDEHLRKIRSGTD